MIATPPSSPPVIVLDNLVKFFGRFAAIRGISASFAPGRLYVVLGDNGAGKSTLLRVVAGLMEPSQGSFTLLGAKRIRDVAHRVGYMGHAPLLYDELSGMENLRYFAGLYGIHDDEVGCNAMRMVGLDPELSRRVGQYSQGMRQRLVAGTRGAARSRADAARRAVLQRRRAFRARDGSCARPRARSG